MLKQGVYEQLMNKELKEKLKQLNLDTYLIEKENLDDCFPYIDAKENRKSVEHKKNDKEALLSRSSLFTGSFMLIDYLYLF
jgi:hypothetical protein